jgi:hypothetical protein
MSCVEVCQSNMQQIEVQGEDKNSIKRGVGKKKTSHITLLNYHLLYRGSIEVGACFTLLQTKAIKKNPHTSPKRKKNLPFSIACFNHPIGS